MADAAVTLQAVLLLTALSSCSPNFWRCPEGCTCNTNSANCRGRYLTKIPEAPVLGFGSFDLSYNLFPIIKNSSFFGFEGVETLLLVSSKIEKIEPGAFASLKWLRVLDLSHNLLRIIPHQLLLHNLHLDCVSLSSNLLTEVPDIPVPLRHLDLSRCKISSIKSHALLKVQSLDLTYNLVTNLTAESLDTLSRIDQIYLNDNPWVCDSRFIEILCLNFERGRKRTPMTCFTKKGNKTYNLPLQEKICSKNSSAETKTPDIQLNNSTTSRQITKSFINEVEGFNGTTSGKSTDPEEKLEIIGDKSGGNENQEPGNGVMTNSLTFHTVLILAVTGWTIIFCTGAYLLPWKRLWNCLHGAPVVNQENQQLFENHN